MENRYYIRFIEHLKYFLLRDISIIIKKKKYIGKLIMFSLLNWPRFVSLDTIWLLSDLNFFIEKLKINTQESILPTEINKYFM